MFILCRCFINENMQGRYSLPLTHVLNKLINSSVQIGIVFAEFYMFFVII